MKSYEEFEATLNSEIGWRKKEISDLLICINEQNKQAEKVLMKSLILLIYAHWEGFIKNSSKHYLNHVAEQKLKLENLLPNFMAITLKESLSQCIENEKSVTLANEINLMNKFSKFLGKKYEVKLDVTRSQDKSIIDTASNLSSKVYKKISEIIGITFKELIRDNHFYIDNQLVSSRNQIGHGDTFSGENSELSLDLDNIVKLRNVMLFLMDSFKNDLLEYAGQKLYLNEKKIEKKIYDESVKKDIQEFFDRLKEN